jgi:hypothetical protein
VTAAGPAVVMDNERPVRISYFEIGECSAVLGRYRCRGSDVVAHVSRNRSAGYAISI